MSVFFLQKIRHAVKIAVWFFFFFSFPPDGGICSVGKKKNAFCALGSKQLSGRCGCHEKDVFPGDVGCVPYTLGPDRTQ